MKARGIFLLVALGASAPIAAFAADPESLKLNLGGTYDSNIAASSGGSASARGLAQSDETFDPSVEVDYTHKIGLQSFFLQGQSGYRFYQKNHILNRERISMAGGVSRPLGNCQGALHGTYGRAQTDLQDFDLGPVNNTQEDISESVSGSCNQSGRLIPSFSLTRSSTTNSTFLRQFSNSKTLSAQGSLLYETQVFGQVSLVGQYSDTEFPRRIVSGLGGADGYQVYSGGVQVNKDFGSNISLAGALFHTSLRSGGGGAQNFDGLTYNASLVYKPTARLQGHLSFSRTTSPSNRIDASYSIDRLLSAGLDYRLTSQMVFKLGASDTQRDYGGAGLFLGNAIFPGSGITNETRKSFFGSMAYNVSPRMSVSLTATHDERHSDVAAFNYGSVRVSLSVSRTF